ncbi:hypothetical protein ACWD6L_29740, partial [Micromonospora profundi]
PTLPVNRLQSYNFADRYVRHASYDARIDANVPGRRCCPSSWRSTTRGPPPRARPRTSPWPVGG